jgi:hypothetical protein
MAPRFTIVNPSLPMLFLTPARAAPTPRMLMLTKADFTPALTLHEERRRMARMAAELMEFADGP